MPSKDRRQRVLVHTNEQLPSVDWKTTYNPFHCLGDMIPWLGDMKSRLGYRQRYVCRELSVNTFVCSPPDCPLF